MDYETLLLDVNDYVATVRMNRPESMNALEYQLRVDLVNCFREFAENEDVRVVILTGTGKAFSAGGDLRELRERMDIVQAMQYVRHVSRVILAIKELEKPVIASVNGAAMGAGFSIVMACDLVVASKRARFSQAFVKVGLVPDLGGTYFLPRLVGLQKAKEFAFTGKSVSAHELVDCGLINILVTHKELENKAFDLARQLAEGPSIALGITKGLLNNNFRFSLEETLEREAQSQAACMQSEDHMEGIAAFYEKRKSCFTGC